MDPAPLLNETFDEVNEHRIVARRAGWLLWAISIATLASFASAMYVNTRYPIVLSHALLAFTLGLRHAVDCDHLAAIDNVTRQLLRHGQRPVSVGFWFAIGHSSIVLFVTSLLAAGYSAAVEASVDKIRVTDELSLAAAVGSVALLCGLGILNAKIALDLFNTWSNISRHDGAEQDRLTEDHAQASLKSAIMMIPYVESILRHVNRPERMVLVGFLFGLSFDTATQVSLIGLSAMSGSTGSLPPWVVMIFPICFSCGMCLVDTLNGLLMLTTYSWATVRPIQKLLYNFVVTALSATVALLISSLEFLQLVSRVAGWHGGVWTWLQGVDMGEIGFGIMSIFAVILIASIVRSRCIAYDMEADPYSTNC